MSLVGIIDFGIGDCTCAGAVPLKASAAGQQQPLPVPPLLNLAVGNRCL
ncbi:hypothetical protein ACLB1M_24280 [Escherichia coli]